MSMTQQEIKGALNLGLGPAQRTVAHTRMSCPSSRRDWGGKAQRRPGQLFRLAPRALKQQRLQGPGRRPPLVRLESGSGCRGGEGAPGCLL